MLSGYRPEDTDKDSNVDMREKSPPGRGWGRCKSLLKTEFEIHANVSVSSSNDVKCPFQKETKHQ